MRHNIGIKFLVFFLTACSFVTAVSGGAAIVAIESAGLYVNSLYELQDQQYESIGQSVAVSYAERYVADNFSNLSYIMKDKTYSDPAERADAKAPRERKHGEKHPTFPFHHSHLPHYYI